VSLDALVNLSRKYGADPAFVIAGGGNTSYKERDILYIKASGTALATIRAEHFVQMNREKLTRMWQRTYPADEAEREQLVLEDLMDARLPGDEQKRPSVETLLHDLLPFAYVVHTHPAIVNGLTCSQYGEQAFRELFGDEALWIPITNPGYILSLKVKNALDYYKNQRQKVPRMIFLQNHGVFVASDTPEDIDALYQLIIERIMKNLKRVPQKNPIQGAFGPSQAIAKLLETCPAPSHLTGTPEQSRYIQFRRDPELARFTQTKEDFKALNKPFTPDHIVYAGSKPLFLDLQLTENSLINEGVAQIIKDQWSAYITLYKRIPKTVAISGLGIFGIGLTERAAKLATELMADAAQIACYTESFGGPRHMEEEFINFIDNWEVEQYRSSISTK
jgi:rhamnose utilization protein RhaD (predicted bifunctional aldolase and dehydrogenase)